MMMPSLPIFLRSSFIKAIAVFAPSAPPKQEMKLHEVDVQVSGKANQLLYFIWKNPNTFRVTLGRMAIKIFDRM